MTQSASPWRALGVLALFVLVPLLPFAVVGELPGERFLQQRDDHALGFALTGTALLALDVLLPIPSSVVGALLGARLGFVAGFACGLLGLTLGQLLGYALGRFMPARWASELPRAPTLAVVFLSRPVPVLAEAVALTAGAERVPLGPFVAAAAAGNAVYAGVMAANGAALLPDDLLGVGLLLPMAVPVLSYLLWRWLRRVHS